MPKIYTTFKGKVEENELLNETKKGFRVKSKKGWEKIVYVKKQRAGWILLEIAIFFQQRSFRKLKNAVAFAQRQTHCMKSYYRNELDKIDVIEEALSS